MSPQPHLRPGRRQLLILLLAAVGLYVIIPQLGSFRNSLSALSDANWNYIVLAVLFTALSYVAAAGNYCLLAWQRLSYVRTLLVQIAGMFVNRLLPAGIGGIGVNYLYLHKSGHSGTRAASVVAANNLLGIIGNLSLVIVLLALFHNQLPDLKLWPFSGTRPVLLIVLVIIAAWIILYRIYGQRLVQKFKEFLHQVLDYRQRPGRTLLALACSIGLTIANVLSFWYCAQAVHINLSFVTILLVFNLGVLLGTATPTPGGLGGVEAGLVAGLVLYHIDGATALAAALTYRLISYWLPLLVGAGALIYVQRRRYL